MLNNILISVGATCLVIATASEIIHPPSPKILYNPSASAPVGYYKVGPKTEYEIGDRVAAFAPERARRLADRRGYLPYDYPLIKTIVGRQGSEICSHDGVVSVPNYPGIQARLRDSLGRELPSSSGCFVLQVGEYFLLSAGTEAGLSSGFDSRYFGPVTAENILGSVDYLGGLKSPTQRSEIGNRLK